MLWGNFFYYISIGDGLHLTSLLAIADDYVSSTFRISVIEEVVKYILARSEINTQKKFVSQSQYKNTLNKKKTTKNNRE
jgi:DNA-binding response OmpR family regulator